MLKMMMGRAAIVVAAVCALSGCKSKVSEPTLGCNSYEGYGEQNFCYTYYVASAATCDGDVVQACPPGPYGTCELSGTDGIVSSTLLGDFFGLTASEVADDCAMQGGTLVDG